MLEKPDLCNSVIKKWLDKKFGNYWLNWEPFTLSQMLPPPVTDSLMAKVLATQTILVTNSWTYDYEVLFNFALSEDGIPAASDAFPYPIPEQLCWSIIELQTILDKKITKDEGFDPDNIDPAIATLLLNEGFVYPPKELEFCEDVLKNILDEEHHKLMNDVKTIWNRLKGHSDKDIEEVIINSDKNDPLTVQISRLVDCKNFTLGKSTIRSNYERDYLSNTV